jgi:hypothetical protein
MSRCSTQTMTTRILSYLTITAVLAGAVVAALEVSDSPLASAWGCSAVSVTSEPIIPGGAGPLLAPTANRFMAGSSTWRRTPTPVVRIVG